MGFATAGIGKGIEMLMGIIAFSGGSSFDAGFAVTGSVS